MILEKSFLLDSMTPEFWRFAYFTAFELSNYLSKSAHYVALHGFHNFDFI